MALPPPAESGRPFAPVALEDLVLVRSVGRRREVVVS